MSTFSRLRYVIAANVNALIEKAEDPEKLLRALIREMEDAGEEARLACAGLLAEQQHLDRAQERLAAEVTDWQKRAEDAVDQGRDDLAREAIRVRVEIEARRQSMLDEQNRLAERVNQMEKDMATLKSKLAEAKTRLKNLQAPATAAQARRPSAQSTPSERKVRRAMERFDHLQAQVESLEARVRSYDVGGNTPSPWSSPAAERSDPAIEAELAQLKQRLGRMPSEQAPQDQVQT